MSDFDWMHQHEWQGHSVYVLLSDEHQGSNDIPRSGHQVWIPFEFCKGCGAIRIPRDILKEIAK